MRIFLQTTRLLGAIVISFGLLAVLAGTALAAPLHAKVTDSNPKAGSTIAQPPTTITVTAAENMKPGAENSNLFVYGPSGDLINQGDATVGLNDPNHMSVKIKPEKNGVYVVRWTTVSADDNDPDQGAFTFTVDSTASAVSANANGTQATSPSTAGNTGTPLWTSVVVGLVALLAGFGGGYGLARRSGKPGIADTTSKDGFSTQK
ncbi:copper resistance CopC family protein [Tengunoibacter tsumagoiensis]|uniref:CopC domain-containing protein n=1 Tax=Tengunoibacter tsumagoiensis TaxID=2014871 RepID=A0A402A5Z3_9CHLR|nr:copper resistance protein CopC [Tengunoibacter tsumagoiensis]GCE14421.1 hypothetical protein KTT_42800 [Tengunoibacter tsumagoiensis]